MSRTLSTDLTLSVGPERGRPEGREKEERRKTEGRQKEDRRKKYNNGEGFKSWKRETEGYMHVNVGVP